MKSRRRGLALALVRDLRNHRVSASQEDPADLETDVLAGFVLARALAGLADSTIRDDTSHLELIRDWFGRAAAGDAAGRRVCLLRQGAA
jgi:integrase/recombinase XerD